MLVSRELRYQEVDSLLELFPETLLETLTPIEWPLRFTPLRGIVQRVIFLVVNLVINVVVSTRSSANDIESTQESF